MKLKVSAKTERFRRAGISFTREPQLVEVDEKTAAALMAEPMLSVAEVPEEKTGQEEDGKEGNKAKKPKADK